MTELKTKNLNEISTYDSSFTTPEVNNLSERLSSIKTEQIRLKFDILKSRIERICSCHKNNCERLENNPITFEE